MALVHKIDDVFTSFLTKLKHLADCSSEVTSLRSQLESEKLSYEASLTSTAEKHEESLKTLEKEYDEKYHKFIEE